MNNNIKGNPTGFRQACDFSNCNFWNTSTEGNYWSDWTSPDNDSDGIVDFPYYLDGGSGACDHFPLTTAAKIYETPLPAPLIILSVLLLTAIVARRRDRLYPH